VRYLSTAALCFSDDIAGGIPADSFQRQESLPLIPLQTGFDICRVLGPGCRVEKDAHVFRVCDPESFRNCSNVKSSPPRVCLILLFDTPHFLLR